MALKTVFLKEVKTCSYFDITHQNQIYVFFPEVGIMTLSSQFHVPQCHLTEKKAKKHKQYMKNSDILRWPPVYFLPLSCFTAADEETRKKC